MSQGFDTEKRTYPSAVGAVVYKSTDQSFDHATLTPLQITFDTVTFDSGDLFDDTNDRIYAPYPGLYLITGFVQAYPSSYNFYRRVEVYVNGTAVGYAFRNSMPYLTSKDHAESFGMPKYLDAGDYVELWFTHPNSFSGKTVYGTSDVNQFGVVLLAASYAKAG